MSASLFRFAVAAYLASFGLAKIMTSYSPEFLLPKGAHYAIAVLELLLAGLLATRRRTIAVYAITITISAAGILIALLIDAPCGCAGTLLGNDRRLHVVISAAGGVLASLALQSEHLLCASRQRSFGTSKS